MMTNTQDRASNSKSRIIPLACLGVTRDGVGDKTMENEQLLKAIQTLNRTVAESKFQKVSIDLNNSTDIEAIKRFVHSRMVNELRSYQKMLAEEGRNIDVNFVLQRQIKDAFQRRTEQAIEELRVKAHHMYRETCIESTTLNLHRKQYKRESKRLERAILLIEGIDERLSKLEKVVKTITTWKAKISKVIKV